jgi:hypothetical protein
MNLAVLSLDGILLGRVGQPTESPLKLCFWDKHVVGHWGGGILRLMGSRHPESIPLETLITVHSPAQQTFMSNFLPDGSPCGGPSQSTYPVLFPIVQSEAVLVDPSIDLS